VTLQESLIRRESSFPFGSITCIRFKGYHLSPKGTPKVQIKSKKKL